MPARTFLATLVLTSVGLAAPASALSCLKPGDLGAERAAVVKLVNAERQKKGLPALRSNDQMNTAAQRHSCDNAQRQIHSHISSDGSELGARLKRAGYRFRAATENTARGFRDAREVVKFWMASPGHRANILLPQAKEVGLGLSLHKPDDGKRYWVLVTGARR